MLSSTALPNIQKTHCKGTACSTAQCLFSNPRRICGGILWLRIPECSRVWGSEASLGLFRMCMQFFRSLFGLFPCVPILLGLLLGDSPSCARWVESCGLRNWCVLTMPYAGHLLVHAILICYIYTDMQGLRLCNMKPMRLFSGLLWILRTWGLEFLYDSDRQQGAQHGGKKTYRCWYPLWGRREQKLGKPCRQLHRGKLEAKTTFDVMWLISACPTGCCPSFLSLLCPALNKIQIGMFDSLRFISPSHLMLCNYCMWIGSVSMGVRWWILQNSSLEIFNLDAMCLQ